MASPIRFTLDDIDQPPAGAGVVSFTVDDIEPTSQGERTSLSPADESRFREWVTRVGIPDVDHPDSFYDYRGFWRESGGPDMRFGVDHFPDTYKQHGHPTFSVESKYSAGPRDGGRWLSDTDFVPPQDVIAPMSSHEPPELPSMNDLIKGTPVERPSLPVTPMASHEPVEPIVPSMGEKMLTPLIGERAS
jgi:hypothetical protein